MNRLTWLADAARPAEDVGRLLRLTGRGTPRAGVHGELLLVRASIEATIGWDFGPRGIVEDAQFAPDLLRPLPGSQRLVRRPLLRRVAGVPPATSSASANAGPGGWRAWWSTDAALRGRLLLLQAVAVWVCGPLQHPALVLAAGLLVGKRG